MNRKIYEAVFLLDMSGSMFPMKEVTVDGYNSMLQEQKNTEKEVFVTTVVFNTERRFFHKRVPINEVSDLTLKEYIPGGNTALYDAVGQTITDIRTEQQAEIDKGTEIETLFVISTDGRENASKEFRGENVRDMISWIEKNLHWEFVFLGAGLGTAHEAKKLRISNSYIASEGEEGHKELNQRRRKKLKDFLN